MRTLLTLAAAAACAAGALAVAGPAVQAAPTGTAANDRAVAVDAARVRACTGTIQIGALTFNPPQVFPGQGVTATAVARNCTRRQQQVSTVFYSRFVGATPGIPAGCPVIDPLPPQPVTVAPGATFSFSAGYLIFSSCTATGLEATARVSDGATGATLATRTATVPIGSVTPSAIAR